MAIIYNGFSEIEDSVREAAPPLVYKYRDWDDTYNQKIITERVCWFAHPHDLNDPYDIRPPYNFIVGNIDWAAARAKIYEAGRIFERGLSEEELQRQVDLRLAAMQADPVGYFQRNRTNHIEDRSNYDQVGVLSCCSSGTNVPMWAYYGKTHKGFAIGFKTVPFARAMNCGFGYVDYSDAPIDYEVFGNKRGNLDREMFQKAARWNNEEEFRFLTVGIGLYRGRAAEFPVDAVEDVLVGMDTDAETTAAIVAAAAVSLPGVPVYRMATQQGSYGFQRIPV